MNKEAADWEGCLRVREEAGERGVGMVCLGEQLSQLEAHFRRGTETLAQRDSQIAQLNDSIKALHQKCEDEKKNFDDTLARKQSEFDKALASKAEECKSRLEEQRTKFDIEMEGLKIKQNSDILKLAKGLRDEMESVEEQFRQAKKTESELSAENERLKAQVLESGRALARAKECSGRLERESHSLRLELLKETNTKERLIDELKRAAREVARLAKANEELTSSGYKRQIDIGHKVNEIHKMLVLSSNRKIENEIVNVRLDIGDLVKGNAALMGRLEEMERFQRHGGREAVSVGVQTKVGEERMKQFEIADREALDAIMKLREELVACKSQLIDTKQQNEVLRQIVRELKKYKEEVEEAEEGDELRIRALEASVREMKEMVDMPRRADANKDRVAEELEALKRQLEDLKMRQLQGIRVFDPSSNQHSSIINAEPKQTPHRLLRPSTIKSANH